MQALQRIGKGIDIASGFYCFIGMAVVFIIGFLLTFEAIAHFFGYSTVWIYWSAQTTIALIPFFTSPYAMREFQHVRVTLFENFMTPRTAIWSQIFGWAMFFVFNAVGGYFLLKQSWESFTGREIAEIITIPIWWLYFLAGLGMVILCLQIIRGIGTLYTKLTPELKSSKKIYGQPWFVVGLYLIGIVLSVWSFVVEPTVGVFIMLLVFLFAAIPIAAGMGLIAYVALFHFGGFEYMAVLGVSFFEAMNDFTWLAFPLFVLGGFSMQRGMASGLFKVITNWIGWIPGGLVIAVTWTAVLLGAMLGSAFATLACLVILCLPELDKAGYPRHLTLPLMASASVLAYLIPPSISLVIFGVLTSQSIGALFMAGVFPGITLAIVRSVYSFIWVKLYFPEVERVHVSWKERFTCIPPNLDSLFIPVLVVGTIIMGWLTPTEAAAAAMVYVFVLNIIRGDQKLSLPDFKVTFYAGANVIGFMGPLIVGALLSKVALMQYHVADHLVQWVTVTGASKLSIVLLITFLLFLLGCIGEVMPIVIIMIPTVFPALYSMGIHPWWMCVYLIFIGAVGGLTPPVGGTTFALAGMTGVDSYYIFRRIIPWVIMDFVAIIIMYIFPWIVTWLPTLIGFSQPAGF